MIESDADRLAMLASLGGEPVACAAGSFTAIFDRDYVLVGEVDETAPVLTARTSDVTRLGLRKGTVLTVAGESYRIRTPQHDGVGMTRLVLEQA